MPRSALETSSRTATLRTPLDPMLRRQIHGPIQPMDEPGLITELGERLLRFLRAL
ncbi:hypothetical protein [Novosphingobium sp. MBES04]|uniref:hypothetical protein n=1 Tax=Novosphingobium sp. MBES04 TaxID=1206458 RepID=UPI00072323E9|nr:hypothetical protein [Novosphingobium sp. MBES04]GAM07328.1 hypothetical protein MBENS4_4324 [Novosphingobium sp. MBES04]